MLRIAVCDDSRTDVEMLEAAFDELPDYPVEYDVYFSRKIWKQLDEKVFTHIHVSYIINLGHIRAIEGDEVVLDNAERLLIARYQKQGLKEKHMELMKRMV